MLVTHPTTVHSAPRRLEVFTSAPAPTPYRAAGNRAGGEDSHAGHTIGPVDRRHGGRTTSRGCEDGVSRTSTDTLYAPARPAHTGAGGSGPRGDRAIGSEWGRPGGEHAARRSSRGRA